MRRIFIISLSVSLLFVSCILVACDTAFQDNPHGLYYVNQLTPAATVITVVSVSTDSMSTTSHLSTFGLGASLEAIASQYGQPTKYTKPPLYAFQDENDAWPQGSLSSLSR